MVGAERLLADRQRALEERPRPGEIALGLKQEGEVVEAHRRIGMVGAERLLADRQRALEERPRLSIGRERPVPVCREPIRASSALCAPSGSAVSLADQSQGDAIQPPRPRPSSADR